LKALSFDFLFPTLVMITVMTYGFSPTCTWLRIYCSRIYWVFLLSHLASKRFVTSVGFYLFFRFPNGIYHHGTATEMGGRTASTGYDTAQEARAEHSSAHITLLAAHM